MGADYLYVKLLHVLIAVVALGTSAGLGIVLELYGDDQTHGAFVLRAIERMLALVVLPGYVLMLATGLWAVSMAWSFTATWIQLALGLWVAGIVILASSLATIRRQRLLQTTEGQASARYRRTSLFRRILGGAFGFVIVAILYLMIFKP
jgi:uncharacterized membrane protein